METLPQPHVWPCERCGEPIQLWSWGYHPPREHPTEAHAQESIIPPDALCSPCLVELAPPDQRAYLAWEQNHHHEMRGLIGDPPGTLIAWRFPLPDRTGRVDASGTPIVYPATIYIVRVDWWNCSWPQFKGWWGPENASPLLVTFGARVIAGGPQLSRASWVFLWSWTQPEKSEICRLDPPNTSLTDSEAVDLNHARAAFYTFEERRGLKHGMKLAWPSDEGTWHDVGARARANFIARHGRPPFDTELAAEMVVPKATFIRRKREWGAPGAQA